MPADTMATTTTWTQYRLFELGLACLFDGLERFVGTRA